MNPHPHTMPITRQTRALLQRLDDANCSLNASQLCRRKPFVGLRMLTPRELFRAQGFPESYQIERGGDGRVLTKTAQVRMCGNSVCPPMAKAYVAANYTEAARERMVA